MAIQNWFYKYLSLEQVVDLSRELANNIRKEFEPEIVVCIDYGGLLPGIEVADELKCGLAQMVLRRNVNLSYLYNSVPDFLIPFVKAYNYILVHNSLPVLEKGIDENISDATVAIVDDAIHSGKTMELALLHTIEKHPENIITASLTYFKEKPDFSILHGRFLFPWSREAVDHEEYLEYMNSRGFSLSSD